MNEININISQKVAILILSGDGDFVELVRHLKGEGVRVEIAAIPDSTAAILVKEADYFHEVSIEDSYVLQQNAKRTPSTPEVLPN